MSLITKPPGADRGGVRPLITKPDATVFQDSTAVKVVRGSRDVAVEGAGAAGRTMAKLWFGMVLVVFILTGLSSLPGATNPLGLLVALPLIGGAIWLLVKLFGSPKRPTEQAIKSGTEDPLRGISVPFPPHLRPAPQPTEAFHVDYFQRALTEKAALLGVVGLLLMSMVIGIWLIARALLLVFPLVLGNRTCVAADENGLTVHSLLGKQTLAWDRIDEVEFRTFGFWSVWVSTTTGSRRCLVVTGRQEFQRAELLIPYTLCGLDKQGALRLAERIMAHKGEAPRAATAPRRVSVPASAAAAPAPASRDTPEATFDPDAIMARYLAEREQLVAQAAMPRPGVQGTAARGFGRKGLG